MTDEFDYITYARKQLAELTPEGRDWGSYPADIDDWNGNAQCVTDTFCYGTDHPCPEDAHTCASDLVRVGFEKCEDCYFPGEYAQLLAATPGTFRALLAEIDRLRAFVDDQAQHGLRFDLNPTVDSRKGAAAYLEYLARIDRSAREQAALVSSGSPERQSQVLSEGD